MSRHCEKHEKKQNCCNAINEAIGNFFLKAPQIINGTALNSYDPLESVARTQLFEQFLQGFYTTVRAVFANLFTSAKYNCCKSCCVGTANAISNSAIGTVTLAYQASLALGNPVDFTFPSPPVPSNPITLNYILYIDSDPTKSGIIATGFNQEVALILAGSGCDQ